MFCQKCGTQLNDDAAFCSKCGVRQGTQSFQQSQSSQQQYQQSQHGQSYVSLSDNSKLFSIISYIGILWLVGLLVAPDKDNPKVKYHVGQGMILTISIAAVSIAVGIFTAILFIVFGVNWAGGYSYIYRPHWLAAIMSTLLWLGVSAYSIIMIVIGVINANNGVEKPLPIIGRFAFYGK